MSMQMAMTTEVVWKRNSCVRERGEEEWWCSIPVHPPHPDHRHHHHHRMILSK